MAALLATLLLALGCGTNNPLGRVPVTGKVTLDGAPLDFGSITFSPKSANATSSGAVIVNGEYSIPESKGLPPGEYAVRINATSAAKSSAIPAEGPAQPGTERVAARFNVQSTLAIKVPTDDQHAAFDFATLSK